jgi:hypothetical protein
MHYYININAEINIKNEIFLGVTEVLHYTSIKLRY